MDVGPPGPGRLMKYPYSQLGMFFQFPWKYHWKNARAFRFLTYSLIASSFILYPINKFVNSTGNVKLWTEVREKRKHDTFARPTEHGGGGHH